MIRKIKVTDYPRLMEIWESAVLSTHDFLKEEDFIYLGTTSGIFPVCQSIRI